MDIWKFHFRMPKGEKLVIPFVVYLIFLFLSFLLSNVNPQLGYGLAIGSTISFIVNLYLPFDENSAAVRWGSILFLCFILSFFKVYLL